MRRVLALFAAVAIVASLAATSVVAAGPHQRVNRMVGNFDLVSRTDPSVVVAHVVVDFVEQTDARLVPGSLDIYWQPYDTENPPFPFLYFGNGVLVRESHAQLLGSWFYDEVRPEVGYTLEAATGGYLCDYVEPQLGGCRHFDWVVFDQIPGLTAEPRQMAWQFNGPDDYTNPFAVGPGSFVITYAGRTGS